MKRRNLLLGTTTVLLSSVLPAYSQSTGEPESVIVSQMPPLPADLASHASEPAAQYVETDLVGTAPPSQDEIRLAYDLLTQSPFGVPALEVAQ
jgi:hypothetical protein